jgi:tryptophan-rich sensory protein
MYLVTVKCSICFTNRCNFHWEIEQSKKLHDTMRSILYVIAVIMVIGWTIGFFAYSAGSIIHILLVIAIIVILLNIIQGRRA